MEFFTNPEIAIGTKMLEIIYIIVGLITINTGIKNFRDEKNPEKIGTGVFWTILGIIISLGRWIPPMAVGVLIVIMSIPAIMKKVKIGTVNRPTDEETANNFKKIGFKIFMPALTIGACAVAFAIYIPALGALVGLGFGICVSIVLLMIFSNTNKPSTFLNDSERLLSTVGPLCMLPMLLASLGAIFTAAGVGQVISKIVGQIIPEGNVTVGIIVFAISMAVFTMIMGNGYAAITVLTVGIGAPFVLSYGADPVLIGMVALTCGFCGTLCTPMAANFNIVPVAMLDMKDRFGVIKNQVIPAIILLTFQIVYMVMFAF